MDAVKQLLADVGRTLVAFATSWAAAAAAATCVVAFGTHLLYAPERLPPTGLFTFAQLGLPTAVLGVGEPLPDLGEAGVQARAAAQAAQPYLENDAPTFFQQNPQLARIVNVAAFGISIVLLVFSLIHQVRRRRTLPGGIEGPPHQLTA